AGGNVGQPGRQRVGDSGRPGDAGTAVVGDYQGVAGIGAGREIATVGGRHRQRRHADAETAGSRVRDGAFAAFVAGYGRGPVAEGDARGHRVGILEGA